MNNRDRSFSPGSAISGRSGNLRFMVPIDAGLAGHKATDLGLKGVRGQREGRVARIGLRHWQLRNDTGWPVSGSW